MNDSQKVGYLLLIIGLAGVLFLSGLGSVALTDRDEGRNAEAGREMLRHPIEPMPHHSSGRT